MSTNKLLRVGVIGTGEFAEICHIPGIISHPHANVVAVCGRNIAATKRLGDKFNIKITTTDFDILCSDPMIDAITIASANVAHAEHAIKALRHGKHVFCEKPLAISVQEASEMAHIAVTSGKVHQVGFTFRYNYGVHELRRRIAAGDIGNPYFARIQYDRWDGLCDSCKTGSKPKNWVADAGMLLDLGSHLFDITKHVMGEIDSVIGYTHVIPRRVRDGLSGQIIKVQEDDMVNAWIRHTNGARAQFFISRVTPPFGQLGYLEVIGEHGALKAALSRGTVDTLRASSPTNKEWQNIPLNQEAYDGKPHALKLMMHSFVDACICGQLDNSKDASFIDGLATQRAIHSLLESEKTFYWTRLIS